VAHTHRNESYQTWWNISIDFLGFYKKNKKFEQTLHFCDLPAQGPPPPSKFASWQLRGRGGKLAGAGRAAAAGSKKAGGSGRRAIM